MINPLERGEAQRVSIEQGDIVFVCEGLEDCALVEFLTGRWDPRPKIGTKAHVENLSWADELQQLARQVPMRRPAAVLFVFDAEASRQKAVAALRKNCTDAGFTLPRTTNRIELKKVGGVDVRIGFHINPHEQTKGAIESLFLPQIKASPEWPCLDALMGCYREAGLRVQNREKTIVRTFIARRRPHNTGLKVALHDKILHCDSPEFGPIKDLLQQILDGVK